MVLQARRRQQLVDFFPDLVGLLLREALPDALAVDHDLVELRLRQAIWLMLVELDAEFAH